MRLHGKDGGGVVYLHVRQGRTQGMVNRMGSSEVVLGKRLSWKMALVCALGIPGCRTRGNVESGESRIFPCAFCLLVVNRLLLAICKIVHFLCVLVFPF